MLIFAQQHGNEQSGKEGALLLSGQLLRPENRYLFDRIDLLLIVNPDGTMDVPTKPGIGVDVNMKILDKVTVRSERFIR